MIYSQLYSQNKARIPTILAVLFICLIILFYIKIFSGISVPSKATNITIERIDETNLLSSQLTVFWRTSQKESGCIFLYDKNKKPVSGPNAHFINLDERDSEGEKGLYFNHYVTIKGLNKNEPYFYRLGGGNNKTCVRQYGDSRYFKTPGDNTVVSNLSPASGRVIKSNGQPLEDATVLVEIKGAYKLSTRTKGKGEWVIPMINIYLKDSLQQKVPQSEESVNIEMVAEDNQVSWVTTDLTKISPLPQTIIIGNKYDFSENVLAATNEKEAYIGKVISIIYPEENAVVPGRKPIIKGTALPRVKVTIIVKASNSTFTSSVVESDKDGSWRLVLPSELQPGKYELKVTTKNQKGQANELTRQFTIAKSGEQVLGEATPEATITQTETLMPTSTLVPSALTGPVPAEPVSGGGFNSYMWGSASLIIIGMGILLAF